MLGRSAEHGERAGVHQDPAVPRRAAEGQQRLGGAQVGPHAQVEICLALPAHRRGQVEDHLGPGQRVPSGPGPGHRVPPGRAGFQQFVQLAADDRDPGIGGQVGRRLHPVDERHPRQRARRAACELKRTRREQFPGQPRAKEARAPGNHHVHHNAYPITDGRREGTGIRSRSRASTTSLPNADAASPASRSSSPDS